MPLTQLADDIEYKYVVQAEATKCVKKWEGGQNRKLKVSDIQVFFDTPEVTECILKAHEYPFEYQGAKMLYVHPKTHLILLDAWQN